MLAGQFYSIHAQAQDLTRLVGTVQLLAHAARANAMGRLLKMQDEMKRKNDGHDADSSNAILLHSAGDLL